MQLLLVSMVGILGLALGSFANVPIYRWPRGGTVVEPRRSTCPSCGKEIRALDNVPIVSWLLLRGRCRHCREPIPPRYLAVEALIGALFAVVTLVWGRDPLLFALLVVTWSLVVASFIDLEHRIIPNRLTLRLPLVLLPLILGSAWFDGAWTDLRRSIIAGIALPGVMLVMSEMFRMLRGQSGIGMGDIKLAISIGLMVGYLGPWHLVVFGYATIVAAMLIVIVLMVMGRAKLATRIPFGPYLAIGTMVVIIADEAATDLVRRILGL